MKRRSFLQVGAVMSTFPSMSGCAQQGPASGEATHLPLPGPTIDPQQDPYIWLEDANAGEALAWSKTRTAATAARHDSNFSRQIAASIEQNLDSPDKLKLGSRHGDFYYNFWRDASHPRGLLRRATLANYVSGNYQWEELIDVDALCAHEKVDWTFHGANILFDTFDRMLIQLSRGGADAVEVREFDIASRSFIPAAKQGFFIPNTKCALAWVDRDTLLVSTEHGGPDSLTESGYPRSVQRWKRGTDLASAPTVFTVPKESVTASFFYIHTPGFQRTFVVDSLDSDRSHTYVVDERDHLKQLDIPETADLNVHKDTMLVTIKEDWTVAGTNYGTGSLLAFSLSEFLAGKREARVVFTPDEHSFLQSYAWTKNYLILSIITDVVSHLKFVDAKTLSHQQQFTGLPDFSSLAVVDTSPEEDDRVVISSQGFVNPPALYYGELPHGVKLFQQAQHQFTSDGFQVKQNFATSDDGTRIPYFVIGKFDDTPRPTLITAYGGFGFSQTPYYLASAGKAWLERGGIYVLANIRGGNEYGPSWHFGSVKAHKYHCYQDFSSVARDIVKHKISSPELLACRGGSNGGLLVGVMFSQYADLFRAVVCEVPLLDMYRYVYINAGASWIGEYGDPRIPADWAYIGEYSPYQNIPVGRKYPALFLQTTTRDDRVGPGHARKFAARLEEQGIAHEFYENYEGGHGLGADNAQVARYQAYVYDFLWHELNN